MNFVGDASKDSSKKTQLYLPPGCQHSNATPNLYLFGFKFLPQISSPLSPNFSKTSRPAGMPPDSESRSSAGSSSLPALKQRFYLSAGPSHERRARFVTSLTLPVARGRATSRWLVPVCSSTSSVAAGPRPAALPSLSGPSHGSGLRLARWRAGAKAKKDP